MELLEVVKTLSISNLKNVYLMYGNEQYLFELFLEKLKNISKEQGFDDFNYSTFDLTDSSFTAVLESVNTLPVMSNYRFVVCKNFAEGDFPAFEEYLKSINPTTIFVVFASYTPKKIEALKKKTEVLELKALDKKQLSAFIKRKMKALGKEVDLPIVELIISQSGYLDKNSSVRLYDVHLMLEKVASHGQGESIRREDVMTIQEKPLEKGIFDLTDYIGERNVEMAVKVYRKLLADGAEPTYLLIMISKHIRNLKRVKNLSNQGFSPSLIAEKLGMHAFVAKKVHAQSLRFNEDMIDLLIKNVAECDYHGKTGRGNALDKGIEILILKLCYIDQVM